MTYRQKMEFMSAYAILRSGKSLSDSELNGLIKVLTTVEETLKMLGEKHHFSWRAIHDDLQLLNQFKQARKS